MPPFATSIRYPSGALYRVLRDLPNVSKDNGLKDIVPQDNSAIKLAPCSVGQSNILACRAYAATVDAIVHLHPDWVLHRLPLSHRGRTQWTEACMPVFDRSASRPGRAEANFLRGVLGPAKPNTTSFQRASHDSRRRQRRATVTRALIVLVLLGLFCGSAAMMSDDLRTAPDAAEISPPAAIPAPFRAHTLNTRPTPGEAVAAPA